jgi:di/tricarboxylate transporter
MTWEIAFVFVVIAVALALFVSERYPIDQVALAIPVVLLVGGIISPAEAVSGFSNTATVTVAAMLILGLGLVKTGVIAAIARWALTAPLGPPQMRLAILCLVVAGTSPFLNNTAVVVVFLPVFLSLAYQEGEAPSRYLMPLSFAAILGGTVTLVGTSTNLVVYGIAESHGLNKLTMFSIAPLGLVCLAAGMLYLFTIGRWIIPRRMGAADLSGKYQVRQFLAELAVQSGSAAIGKSLGELKWRERYGVSILGLGRGDRSVWAPGSERHVVEGDILYAQGTPQQLLTLSRSERLDPPARRAKSAIDFISENARLMEVMIGPHCTLAEHTLGEARFQQRHGAMVLAIQRHGVTIRDKLESLRLAFGDLLLVHGPVSALDALAEEPGFVPLRMVGLPVRDRPRALVSVGILLSVVAAGRDLLGDGLDGGLPAGRLAAPGHRDGDDRSGRMARHRRQPEPRPGGARRRDRRHLPDHRAAHGRDVERRHGGGRGPHRPFRRRTARNEPLRVAHHGHVRRVGVLHDADGLPDQRPHLRTGRIPLYRLPQGRYAAHHPPRNPHHSSRSDLLAQLM